MYWKKFFQKYHIIYFYRKKKKESGQMEETQFSKDIFGTFTYSHSNSTLQIKRCNISF